MSMPSRSCPRIRSRGFTLIELMVVLVIIGVLAALIVPNMLDRADDARVTAARTDVNNLMQALKLYKLDNLRYPTGEQGCRRWSPSRPSAGAAELAPYLDKLPSDPWKSPYQYANPGLKGEIDVYSFGADGVAGGDGKNAISGLGSRARPCCQDPGRAAPSPLRSPPSEREGPAPLGPLFGAARLCRRSLGFTLIELMVVVAIIAIATGGGEPGVARPGGVEARARGDATGVVARVGARRGTRIGVAARWEPLAEQADGSGFRFVGLAADRPLPTHWLDASTSAQVIGARAVVLGPEPLIGEQRILLRLDNQRLTLMTDGIGPFAVSDNDGVAR
jgi:general secretion pathway protein G